MKKPINERIDIRFLRQDKNGIQVESQDYESIYEEVGFRYLDGTKFILIKSSPPKKFKNVEVWEEIFYYGNKSENDELFSYKQIAYYFFRAKKSYPKNNSYKEIIYEVDPVLFMNGSRKFNENMYNTLVSDKFWNNYEKKSIASELNGLRLFEYAKLDLHEPENKKYLIWDNDKKIIERDLLNQPPLSGDKEGKICMSIKYLKKLQKEGKVNLLKTKHSNCLDESPLAIKVLPLPIKSDKVWIDKKLKDVLGILQGDKVSIRGMRNSNLELITEIAGFLPPAEESLIGLSAQIIKKLDIYDGGHCLLKRIGSSKSLEN